MPVKEHRIVGGVDHRSPHAKDATKCNWGPNDDAFEALKRLTETLMCQPGNIDA
jgi:hypothetical protein